MSYRNRRDENRQATSVDRIRRRMERIEEERRARPRINPFTLISIAIVLILALITSNLAGN